MNHEKQHASIKKYAEYLIQALIPQVKMEDRSEEHESPCFEFDGWVYLTYVEEERAVPTIAGPRPQMVREYAVDVAKFIPGSHWEPDDVDIIPDQSYSCLNDALGRVVNLIVANALEQKMEADAEYEAWQESQKYAEELKNL